ncbi:MAG: bifunctional (p)ppGpp synthetase/guanosine-3',5'-bis(diphosphate) 3'-pyrophosphohydrolase [Nitrospira sp.]|jgi:guanosine-3',5'-bis(diphosphate) 3'-pyrophosphohydrolase|nr:bifunctional (p)ppGpp synthetase/guanosine-3',5'-bis(diphosphate) 3'-pyrophosphohydrolase [Nitrospira sp.]MDH4242323.1 bifunctional (p)ppGpp synthetase/guanosine-3',5'-bis(diphosphate) 3'-pyrophosphohydrolase [Nitrospira sp.]MDH4356492.1 bifunctional (p)ppGpp synthetase/guanosine-3',5'-bis(diphosphate) 3'-pyrophosphohydrolase [Nitrospira sp.]MDH5318251.1 bifunctional (p)ppGpp synthetase/guanosine-3',5'-bis(diphosphate) 3'-pyrophosphohydrolase [Nitrospira sp.]
MMYETVTDIDQLLTRLQAYQPEADLGMVRKAYEFSARAHEGQTRRSGEPYVKHPVAVAGVLTSLKTDVTAIVAGLLHDTLEDTVATADELQKEFGKEVVHLVDGVTKIGKITFRSSEERQAENFRKMVLSMADDIRVVIIKLADRLHNMRTLEHLKESKRHEIAKETLEIYAPLANRIGIGWVKNELEDLCLKHLNPDIYETLRVRVAKRDEDRQQYIQEVRGLVEKALAENGLVGAVNGRPKHLYGIYQKMKKQSISFEEVYDLTALRIITDTKMNCYALLGVIHSLWRPLPGRFKDYIAIPKSNLYQSLHTTVVGPKGEHVEFQIRTEEMHRVAEYGIAAHWKYKEQGRVQDKDSKTFGWLRQFIEWQQDLPDNRQFMDSVKLELFHDVVYVFTPKGIVKELPKGATPVDFAYAIHTEVGDHCVGAKVNGKIVPLKHEVSSGDTIEILTSPNQTPHKDWLKFVRTSRAKTKIKHWIKSEEQKRSLEIGRRLLESELRRHGLAPSQVSKSDALLDLAKQEGYATIDELAAAVGFGHVSTAQIVGRLLAPMAENRTASHETEPVPKVASGRGTEASVQVRGGRDLLMQLSRCCNPVPGDRILGYITRGRGLTIHSVDCPNLGALDYDRNRLVEVEWDTATPGQHAVNISVIAEDRTGVLANVSSAIAGSDANISRAEITTREDRKAELHFVVEISDTNHLYRVLKAIERVNGVITARRLRSWRGKM